MNSSAQYGSPRWSTAVKLVVALSIATIILAIIMRFRSLIGPLLLVFVLTYLLHPAAAWLNRKVKLPWPLAVTLLFTVIILILLGLVTWGGLAIFSQLQSFIIFIQGTVDTLPATIAKISSQTYSIGPFNFDLSMFDLSQVINSILGGIEPILANIGTLVAGLAGGAAEVIGWIAFILLVSYFILLETKGNEGRLFMFEIPGYADDFRRLGFELSKIWNAFLRGQMLIIIITVVVYLILLSILGVRFALGLAFLAGMARFVPYAGPAIAWTTLGLVSYFQVDNFFQFPPLAYVLLTVGLAWFTDVILDNFVATRMLAKTLRIHPASVMVMALIGANLIGILGMVLASPVMASLKLFWHYIIRKMFDLNPWDGLNTEESSPPPPNWLLKLQSIWVSIKYKILRRLNPKVKKV